MLICAWPIITKPFWMTSRELDLIETQYLCKIEDPKRHFWQQLPNVS